VGPAGIADAVPTWKSTALPLPFAIVIAVLLASTGGSANVPPKPAELTGGVIVTLAVGVKVVVVFTMFPVQ
jgi:hypothetical protein